MPTRKDRKAVKLETIRDTSPELNPGDQAAPGTPGTGEAPCPECGGSGRIGSAPCPTCGGSGRVIKAIGGA